MNIVMIAGQDTHNFVLEYIAKGLVRSRHNLSIYGIFLDDSCTYVLTRSGLSVSPISQLTKEEMEKFDIGIINNRAFYMIPWLMEARIYLFEFDIHYLDEPVVGADFLFERGSGWRPLLSCGSRAECVKMVVGNPKQPETHFQNALGKKDYFLFLDSGHYPFGREGKQALAETLLKICNTFPEYDLIVKPRFLNNKQTVTHKNTIHLYDVIKETAGAHLPKNLLLMQEYGNLTELIHHAKTVLCMYTTAYIDAAVQQKNLIVLDHLPNEENADLRIATHWNVAREIMAGSGCLVDYQNVCDYLPEGITCNQEHLKQHIYAFENVDNTIVQVMEHIWENYLCKDIFPKIGEYFFDTYELNMQADPTLTMDQLISMRKMNYLLAHERYFYKTTAFFPKDSRVTEYIHQLNNDGVLLCQPIESILPKVAHKLTEYAPEIPEDEISQSYLWIQIQLSGDIALLRQYEPKNNRPDHFYHFVLGKTYFQKELYEEAYEQLYNYVTALQEQEYSHSVGEIAHNILSAWYYAGLSAMKLSQYRLAKECFEMCQKLTNNQHGMASKYLQEIRKLQNNDVKKEGKNYV